MVLEQFDNIEKILDIEENTDVNLERVRERLDNAEEAVEFQRLKSVMDKREGIINSQANDLDSVLDDIDERRDALDKQLEDEKFVEHREQIAMVDNVVETLEAQLRDVTAALQRMTVIALFHQKSVSDLQGKVSYQMMAHDFKEFDRRMQERFDVLNDRVDRRLENVVGRLAKAVERLGDKAEFTVGEQDSGEGGG